MNHWKNLKKVVLASGLLLASVTQVWASGGAPAKGYTETDYPIVMVGGFLSFDDILGINYYYQIPGELEQGGATVYPLNLSAFSGTYQRGEQLISALEELQATYGHSKFNLMGHSGGATTIRYVAGNRPDLVASVTSIHGSNAGVPIADLIHEGTIAESVLGAILNVVGTVVEFISGNDPADFPQDAVAMMTDYRTDVTAAFNQDYSAGMPSASCANDGASAENGVRYYSWSGTESFTNMFDILDPLFAVTGLLTAGADDGLIPRCDSHLGEVIRDNYPHNHVDAMNHMFGLRKPFTPNPKQLYRQQANRLQNAGL